VRVQLSSKVDIQSQPLRQGIFDLLQKVRTIKGAEPITSNLPSENIAMGIGSKRIVGTGRTAGILLKKQQKQGIVPNTGGDGTRLGGIRSGSGRRSDDDELTFLKNAIGQEIAFELEKGGGARANLLATKGRIRNKLIDAAAMKVGADIGLVAKVIINERERQLRRKREERQRKTDGGGKRKIHQGDELHFLRDNLGVLGVEQTREEKEKRRLGRFGGEDGTSDDDDDEQPPKKSCYVCDETDELWNLPEDDRKASFQAKYKAEVERQKRLLGINSSDDIVPTFHHQLVDRDDDDDVENIAWEDG
jgi:hypothetical protein